MRRDREADAFSLLAVDVDGRVHAGHVQRQLDQ